MSITNLDKILVKTADEIIRKWYFLFNNSESLGDIVEVSLLVSLKEELQVHRTYESLVTVNIKSKKGVGLSIVDLDIGLVESEDLLHLVIEFRLVTCQDGELVLKVERFIVVKVEN